MFWPRRTLAEQFTDLAWPLNAGYTNTEKRKALQERVKKDFFN
jgi:hypothetical protein